MGDTLVSIGLKQEDKDVDVNTAVDAKADMDADADMIMRQGARGPSYPLGN